MSLVSVWFELKLAIVETTGLSRDMLHVAAGLIGACLLALALKRPLSSPLPLLLVAIAALANEVYDVTFEVWPGSDRGKQWAASVHDLWVTLLAPALLMLGASFRRTAAPHASADDRP